VEFVFLFLTRQTTCWINKDLANSASVSERMYPKNSPATLLIV
jgi:hypothetical protein